MKRRAINAWLAIPRSAWSVLEGTNKCRQGPSTVVRGATHGPATNTSTEKGDPATCTIVSRMESCIGITQLRQYAAYGAAFKRPIPEKVVILYHKVDVDDFIAVADAIEEEFPHVVVEGEETRLRIFEVHAVDARRLVFSCQAPQKPDIDSIVFLMRNIGMANANLNGIEVPGNNPCH